MKKFLLISNAILSFLTVIFALLAFIYPQHLGENGQRFYLEMYVIRAIPFGILVGVVPFFAKKSVAGFIVFAMAIVQIGDAILGLEQREILMTIIPVIAAILFGLISIYFFISSRNRLKE
jgi:hypothetical protein